MIDPDGDGDTGILPDFDVTNYCKPCLSNNINNLYSSLIELGIEIPNSSFGINALDNYYSLRLELEEWVRFAIFIGSETNDHNFIINILSPLSHEWEWEQMLFGVYLKNSMWDSAETLLNSLNLNDPEKDAFYKIQTINLNYLQNLSGNIVYNVSEDELNELWILGQTEIPSSGYARALFKIITGEDIPIELPDKKSAGTRQDNIENPSFKNEELSIYPNPVKNGIDWTIESNEIITSIKVVDLSGNTILRKLVDSQIVKLESQALSAGVYIVEIEFDKKETEFHKIIVID